MQDNISGQPVLPTETIEESRSPRTLLDRLRAGRNWLLIFGAVILASAVVVSWIIFSPRANQSPANVALSIDAKIEVTSGSESSFTVVYENRDRHELKNVLLEMSYPSNLRVVSSSLPSRDGEGRNFNLPNLPAGGSGRVLLRAIINGAPQEIKIIQARLFYALANATATFSASVETKLTLRPSDFNFRITAPTEVVPSQKVDYHLIFQNVTSQNLDRMQVRLNLPAEFEFLAATPPSADRQTWDFGKIQPGEERSLVITGRFTGAVGEEKLLRAELGFINSESMFVVQNSSSFSLRLVESPLKLQLQAERPTPTVLPGESLRFTLTYSNTGLRAFSNVQVGIELRGQAVDMRSVRAGGGALVGDSLVWNAASFPRLSLIQPGERGSLTFSLNIRADFAAAAIKNPTITLTPSVSSYELPGPIISKALSLQTKSGITVITAVDSLGSPPARYRITLRTSGQFNDLREVALQGVINLPVIAFDPDSVPSDQRSQMTYMPASGRLIWRVGELATFASKEISFIVSSSSADTFARTLVKSLEVSGFDAFASENIVPPAVADIVVPQSR